MSETKLIAPQITNFIPEVTVVISAILFVILLFLSIYYLINIGNRFIEKNKRISIDLKLVIKIFAVIVTLYILKLILNKYSIVADTLWALIAGVILSFVINSPVTYLEQKNIKRSYGVLIVYLTIVIIFTILIVSVIPKTLEEVINLLKSTPDLINTSGKIIIDYIDNFNNSFGYDSPFSVNGQQIIEKFMQSINENIGTLQNQLVEYMKNAATGVTAVFSMFLRLFLIFIFSFYFTVDKDKFKYAIIRNLPKEHKDDILYVSRRINTALLDFVKGRLLMAVFVGFLTMIYLLILRVDFAIVIGLITTIADIIPYIGPFLGFIPAVLFALMDSPIKAIWVAVLFVLLQWVENNLIAPKLLGDRTGLNPMLILLAIVVGGGVFGVIGMILGVPVLSIILILLDYAKIKYTKKKQLN